MRKIVISRQTLCYRNLIRFLIDTNMNDISLVHMSNLQIEVPFSESLTDKSKKNIISLLNIEIF